MCAASGRQGLPNLLSVWLNGKIVASSGAGLPASALRLCSPKLAFLSQSFAGVCDFFFSLHNNNKSTGTYFSTISQGGQQVEWTFLKNGSKTKKDQIIFPRVFLTWTVILVIYEKDF